MSITSEELAKVFEQEDVKDFLDNLMNLGKDKTGKVTITAPNDLHLLLLKMIKEKSKVYKLIENEFITSTDGALKLTYNAKPAEFIPVGKAPKIQADELEIIFRSGEKYRLVKVITIDESMKENDFIEKRSYILDSIASGMAEALDNHILNGKGKEADEIDGVLLAIEATNKVDVTPTQIADLIKPIKKVDSGEDTDGEIVALVNRDTYYSDLIEHLLNTSNASVLPRFITTKAMPKGKVLYGDFTKYFIGQRGNISLGSSREVHFLGDDAFKGTAYFVGKPIRKEAFVLVNLI